MEQEKTAQGPEDVWDLTLFADDVKLQVQDEELLARLLRASSDWADKHGMQWSVNKCAILREPKAEKGSPFELSGQQVENRIEADYLGVTATATGTSHVKCIKRIKKATAFLHQPRGNGIHHGTMTTNSMLAIWRTHILPAATYGLHLVPHHNEQTKAWSTMEKSMMVMVMGCFSEKTRPRLRTVAKALTLRQQREIQMGRYRIAYGSGRRKRQMTEK